MTFTIGQLTAKGAAAGAADLFEVQSNGASKSVTGANIASGVTSIVTESIYSRLRRSYQLRRDNNVHCLGGTLRPVMAAPPVIAVTAVVPAGLTSAYIANGAKVEGLLETGGDKLVYAGAGIRYPVATITNGGADGNCSNGRNAVGWRVKIVTNSIAPAFRVVQSTVSGYRFAVADAAGVPSYIAYTGTLAPNAGFSNWIQLTFPSQAEREIWIEGELAAAFHSVCVSPIETVVKAPVNLTLQTFGDSITAATGTPSGGVNDGFAQVFGDCFGVSNCYMSGVGSQGFLAPATTGALYTFRQRLVYDFHAADFYLIAFGTNDEAFPGAALRAEVVTTLQLLRSLTPAPIFMLGCPANASGPSALPIAIDGDYSAAVATFADPDCYFIPNSTALPQSIQNGTGKVGSPNGSGNSDWTVSADSTHPPAAGHFYLGKAYAAQCYAAIANRA